MDDKQEPGKGGVMLPTPCSLGGDQISACFRLSNGRGLSRTKSQIQTG